MRRIVWRFLKSEPTVLIGIGAALGVATGYGALACRWGINAIRRLAFGEPGQITALAASAPWYVVLALPAIGGVIVAPMVYRWAREAKGHGVPEVMEAMARKSGRIRPRVALIKAVASVVTIGTGGAVGWEGPIIQIGAGIGSATGQVLKVARRHMRILVSCGAAAGIAATFNAPIAGVLFALEVFLGDLVVATFTPVVVASVAATAVSVSHFGHHAVFALPEASFHLQSTFEIPLYAVLGLACACGAVAFTRLVYLFEDCFESFRIPDLLKPVVGGLGVGAVGIALPQVLGVGYETISNTFQGGFGLRFLAALFAFKLLAACLTLGSGGSGGIFAPSLVLGAVLGSAFGQVVHGAWPAATAQPGVYSVVGMAALVAGTTHAPMSAVLILFEMTTDYEIILPLMLACVVSSIAARGMLRESIYTLKLARRGIKLRAGRDAAILRSLTVGETMRTAVTVLDRSLPFEEVRRRVTASDHHLFPVVGTDHRLCGVITLDMMRPFLLDDALVHIAVASDLASRPELVLGPEDDLERASKAFVAAGADELVVADPDSRRVLGVLRQRDLHAAYNRAAEVME